ncbi:NAD(P)-dependent oxidoreductase [Mesorhizobium koreense]|uniref:NAD(P)-dependent oxidoreductase n=1 Tax=Mesorhizobium koreense TaxID=3074855 RepID=UPI00287BC6D0|nr:NAD(P)-dependent oxidoreductase [Mesorhizobium sp. WR6]
MRAVFVDATETLAAIAGQQLKAGDPAVTINRQPAITPPELPGVLGDAEIAIIDHTHLPMDIALACKALKHVVFLGTGPRSYMDVDALAESGVTVHIVKGYGDTAVAECAFSLMWASAKSLAKMDRAMRAGEWQRTDGIQLTGKTLGLIGFGGIAAELARMALGCGMKVIAWNRSPKSRPGVEFDDLDSVLAHSDVLSLHLLLTDETRGMISRQKIAKMKPGVILVNTARGALVNEHAMVEALRSGHIRHAGLDVYAVEPLPKGHLLTTLENVTLSAHSAFRTPEASENLIRSALGHCRRIAATGQ